MHANHHQFEVLGIIIIKLKYFFNHHQIEVLNACESLSSNWSTFFFFNHHQLQSTFFWSNKQSTSIT